MIRDQITISDRTCFRYHDAEATHLLVQPIDEHDLKVLDKEVELISQQFGRPFSFVAFMIHDWNMELTPWPAPPVFGKIPFGDRAEDTLDFILHQLLPRVQGDIKHVLLGGYSLAGLFSLWASYHTGIFQGIAAVSPSVWFPKWIDYAMEHNPHAQSIYLSLGDKEEKAKSPVMAQVGNAIRRQHELLMEQKVNTILEWNAGNHFVDSEKRMAKGFAWLLNNQK